MKSPVRTHTWRPDPLVPADHRGRRRCAVCGLPEDNKAHRDAPVDDVSARIVGESGVRPTEDRPDA